VDISLRPLFAALITRLNRFFDADNAWYLVNFETGDQKYGSYGGRNAVHPNVANFIHALVLLTSTAALVTHRPSAELAHAASLAVAPAFAAIRSALLFLCLIIAGFELLDALLATALASIAFSSAFFGAYFLLVASSSVERKISCSSCFNFCSKQSAPCGLRSPSQLPVWRAPSSASSF
jgi:hypothetical protein